MSSHLWGLACWAWMCRQKVFWVEKTTWSVTRSQSKPNKRTNLRPQKSRAACFGWYIISTSLSNISTHVMCDGAVRHWARYNAAACQEQKPEKLLPEFFKDEKCNADDLAKYVTASLPHPVSQSSGCKRLAVPLFFQLLLEGLQGHLLVLLPLLAPLLQRGLVAVP